MLKVLKPGFFTTIQDSGRFGYRDKGVPVSGAMDMISVFRLNTLLENKENAAVLEITMTGPTLLFESDTYIALAGAWLSPTLNNKPIDNYKVYKIVKGDILSYGRLEKGFRSYLAVKGGFKTQIVLGSRSQYFPLSDTKCIAESQELNFEETSNFKPKISELQTGTNLDFNFLEVQKGPEYDMLNDKQLEELFINDFSISKENNRMAYQLNETIEGHSNTVLTSATLPGTVQFTPAGKLIILMKDGQTTGGYPRILQLSEEAISVLAQKKHGDFLKFKLI
ncbi:biotin-dependent carboxyltransferase family protein [Croceitalea sp. MTPC9]|uniref:5-oxoprolinase subunit C family protein n=1 Tax=unclassified Croceitalea TaxID=2632280 RepID=UPI002B3DED3C|nr:biotin-dependent carboxyltransferase family protein [Croceitalea sp. MTPC6]GMN15605.1 biotin-dependent carboxyltransferase family protein [Croceitalea sp. MTPC9]